MYTIPKSETKGILTFFPDKTVYVTLQGRAVQNYSPPGGSKSRYEVMDAKIAEKLWKAGEFFILVKNVFDRNLFVYDVTADPSSPDVLYACGFESSAWRSADGGETWKRIRGYNFKWGYRVVPDTENPGKVFITTFGGGVWYGPAEGDTDAPEDIVTEGVRYEDLGR